MAGTQAASNLNPAQAQAVQHSGGPLLVLAGAGSGKTRVITTRIARLVELGALPERILAVSFTNKAAEEMGERLAKLTPRGVSGKVWLSTFHRFGVRFLQQEAASIWGSRAFVVLDQGDAASVLRELLRREAFSDRALDLNAIMARISLWKNGFITPDTLDPANFEYEYDSVAAALYVRYEERLRALRAVDFDDLIVLPARELMARDDLRDRWQRRFSHILVDEFQDTNRVQLELLRQLTGAHRNVCVVGDDDQSIYSWRGADITNIRDFERHFPGASIVKLEDNYRSRSPILEVANAVIAGSRERRYEKVLRSARGAGDRVKRVEIADGDSEVHYVISRVRAYREEHYDYRHMAILYRSNLQARVIEQELRANGMPYRLLGGTQYFDRKEVKDGLAYLRLLVNPDDEISLRRIINTPARGVGDTSVEHLSAYALAQGVSFIEAVRRARILGKLPDNTVRGCEALLRCLDGARRHLEDGLPLSSVAQGLFNDAGLTEDLRMAAKGGKSRLENLDFLTRALARHQEAQGSGPESLARLIQRLTLRIESEEGAGNEITLATLHAAKGLEFPVVLILGCVEGQLPHARTVDPKVTEHRPGEIDEERRLFYVGITRAQDHLELLVPRNRNLRGKRTPLTPSRFLDGLPEAAIETIEATISTTLAPDELAAMSAALLEQLAAR